MPGFLFGFGQLINQVIPLVLIEFVRILLVVLCFGI